MALSVHGLYVAANLFTSCRVFLPFAFRSPAFSLSFFILSSNTNAGSYSRPSRLASSASVATSSPRNAFARPSKHLLHILVRPALDQWKIRNMPYS
jgi:hypothetical protein